MYTVQCTLYTVQCTLYTVSIHCPVYNKIVVPGTTLSMLNVLQEFGISPYLPPCLCASLSFSLDSRSFFHHPYLCIYLYFLFLLNSIALSLCLSPLSLVFSTFLSYAIFTGCAFIKFKSSKSCHNAIRNMHHSLTMQVSLSLSLFFSLSIVYFVLITSNTLSMVYFILIAWNTLSIVHSLQGTH